MESRIINMKQIIKIALLCLFPVITLAQTPAYQKNPRSLRVTDGSEIIKWKDSIYYKGELDKRLNNSYNTSDDTKSYFVNAVAKSFLTPNHASEGSVISLGSDSLVNFFRSNDYFAHQGDSGKAVMRLSLDRGKTWSVPTMFYNSTYDNRVKGSIYIKELNRVVVFMTRVDAGGVGTVDVGFVYSDDRCVTWSGWNEQSSLLTYTNGQSSFGAPIKSGSEYLKAIGGVRWSQLLTSPDGINWTSKGLMYDYTVSNTHTATNEVAIERVGVDSLIALVRSEDVTQKYAYLQYKSINNGSSWDYVGKTVMSDSLWSPSPFLIYDDVKKNIIAISTRRGNTAVNDAVQSALYFYTAKPADIFDNASGWSLLSKIPRPSPNKYVLYGYPYSTWMPNGDLFTIFTDRVLKRSTTGIPSSAENASLYQFNTTSNGRLLPNEDVNEGFLYYNNISGRFETRSIFQPFSYNDTQKFITQAEPGGLDLVAPTNYADTTVLLSLKDKLNFFKHKYRTNGVALHFANDTIQGTQYATRVHANGTAKVDLGSDATGDILYRKSNGDLGRLPIGATGGLLSVQSGLPAWAAAGSYIINSSALQTGNFNISGTGQAANLRGGTGGTFSVPNGAGTNFSPNMTNTQASGVAGIGVGVLDGTNNGRAALFVDDTNGIWGLSFLHSANARPFEIRNSSGKRFGISVAGAIDIPVTPATSAGSHEILTRNTSSGAVEKVSSSSYPTTSRTLTGGYGILPIGDLSANRTVSADTTSSGGLVSKDRLTAYANSKAQALALFVGINGNQTVNDTKTFTNNVILKGGIIVDNATLAMRDFSGTGFKVSLTPPVTVVGSDKTINIRDQSGTMALTSDISIQPIAVKSADYTLTVSDYTIVTGTSSTTYTLPAASSVPVGKTFVIKNFSSGSITVATTGTELKWNPASFITPVASLTGTISGWMLQTDGTYWYLITGD